ncbi:Uncharacterised protein [Yersinia aleksiciae]|uniref:Uncharacterized protein n=1 Tax=Yersinia aleksiciae TaxID=263819 RepID=A0A0T9UD03_YERAE|nr:Uncharacterised protein [Yersinia aleksiciae]CNL33629.1 Uncharacterised protein [Yersinia aleksiciae]
MASLEILFFTLDDEVFELMKSKHDKKSKIEPETVGYIARLRFILNSID